MNEQPSSARIALKWGVYTALAELLVTSIRYSLNQYTNFLFPVLTLVILFTGTTLAMRELRQYNGGWMTLGEGVGLGLLMFALIGILDTAYQQIYQTYVDPTYVARALDETRNTLERFGATDDQLDQFEEQAENAKASSGKGTAGLAFIGGVFYWILGGLVISLLVAAFVRKVKTNPFD